MPATFHFRAVASDGKLRTGSLSGESAGASNIGCPTYTARTPRSMKYFSSNGSTQHSVSTRSLIFFTRHGRDAHTCGAT